MKFKGTIVITDPCYLRHDSLNSYEYWEKSGYGEDLSVFGCSQWISESTIYGDWSCTTYKGNPEDIKESLRDLQQFYDKVDELSKELLDYDAAWEVLRKDFQELCTEHENKFSKLGRFCADSGMVCVVYLDEVLKVNPTFRQWAEEHTWCVTIIEDFDGDICYEIDDEDEAHIVGEGNISFYTTQTGI